MDAARFDDVPLEPVADPGYFPFAASAAPLVDTSPLNALSAIPALNSLPGAAVSVYLDFDGDYEATWGEFSNVTVPVYDQDGDPTTFSDGELASIEEIWSIVAEDYSPFNLNVTTVEPPSFADGVAVRVAIGGDGTWYANNVGGVGYVDGFTNEYPNTVYVFPDHLGNGTPKYVGDASSHETGHAFGLDHQRRYGPFGTIYDEYYAGSSSLAPIMGNSYDATRGVWWKGNRSTQGAEATQDDLAILSRSENGFGYRPDDHGNTPQTATPMVPTFDGVMASGIITTTDDIDYFSFETDTGQVTITLTVAEQPNLNSRLELRDESGALITESAPGDSFGAQIVANLQAGSYRVVVASQGFYGDLGQYTLKADAEAPAVWGTVFFDADRDGVLDEGEPGLPGWTLYDDLNHNGTWDAHLAATFDSTAAPQAIPDTGSADSTIVVSDVPGTIMNVSVRVNVPHPKTSKLVGILIGPTGAAITLFAFNGGAGEGYLDTTFSAQASTSVANGSPPFSGAYRPLGSLETLFGKNPNGNWKLVVSDIAADGKVGTLVDWSLDIATDQAEPSTTTDADGR